MNPARLTEQADEQLRSEAFSNLSERLREGGRVGKCDFHDLLESELLGESSFQLIFSELAALLLSTESGKILELHGKIRDGIIERYLTNPRYDYLLEEEAAEIEHSSPEPEDAEEVGMA